MTERDRIVERVRAGASFVVSSHQRPDGDAVGSAMGLALALEALGKTVDVVFDAPLPHFLQPFPAVDRIAISTEWTRAHDAAFVMECSALDRTGVRGLDRSPVINIDHHPGNARYGVLNWIDETAAACGEMVFSLVEALGAPLTPEVATHVYLALLTDTGSFHFSHLTPRSFEIARRCVEAGADPQWIARTHYDSNSVARVRLFGAVLNGMVLAQSGRVAILTVTQAMAQAAGGTYDDTDGLINFPLSVKDIRAVAFFKEAGAGEWRVSLRSKGAVDVGAIARTHGGGGHANAAGCSVTGALDVWQAWFLDRLEQAAAGGASA